MADQAEREAKLLRKQVEAQERKNRAAGAGGSSSDDSSGDDGEQSSGSKGSSSEDGQGCTKPDYSGMSRKEKRAAKKAYNKCRSAARSGDSTSYDSTDGSSGDGSGDSGAVTTKSLKRGGKGVRATYHYCELGWTAVFRLSSFFFWRHVLLAAQQPQQVHGLVMPGPDCSAPPPVPDTPRLPCAPLLCTADSPAYETSSLYCADAFRGKESSLLGRPWTAYCAESILGPMSREWPAAGNRVRLYLCPTGLLNFTGCRAACYQVPTPPDVPLALTPSPPPCRGQVRALHPRDQPGHWRLD